MKYQKLDHDVTRSIPVAACPNPSRGPASEPPIARAIQRLRRTSRQGSPGRSSRFEHRLIWFIGLYLVSLSSFGGLVAAVRWTLELL
jgi:hypothetical protein